MAADVREKIFVVCGTNGKTTINNLLCSTLEGQGKKVICNHSGSNMLNGAIAAFVLSAKWNGKIDADYACIEVDEASTLRIFPHFKPDYMILNNLFRDQLDRYGEIDITMNLLKDAMRIAPEMTIIVNGDDALSTYLAQESGNPYALTEFRSKYLKNKASTKSKKDVSAKNVEQNCFTISTITASSGTTTVQTVISTDQS